MTCRAGVKRYTAVRALYNIPWRIQPHPAMRNLSYRSNAGQLRRQS
nr:hypothetical protein [Klebsiella variicola]